MNEVEQAIADAIKAIRRAQNLLNYPIMATPTGPRREKITGSNIHLGSALMCLLALDENQPKG